MLNNPFSSLNPVNQPSADFKQLYQAFTSSQNPMQMFMSMAAQNPQMQPIIQALQRGTSPQQIFNNICQQRGIDPNMFLDNLKK